MEIGGHYIEVDGVPVREPSLEVWGTWLEKADRVVAQTRTTNGEVSTVFLGLNHRWGDGPPLLYETMIFGGTLAEEQERYSTREEAFAGHEAWVRRVLGVRQYPARACQTVVSILESAKQGIRKFRDEE